MTDQLDARAARDHVRMWLVLISAGIGLHAFNEFAIVAALPRAAVGFGGERFVGLVTALYAIGSVGGGLTGVLIRRRFGVKVAMALGVCTFMAGALIAMSAPGMAALATGRCLSGLSEGLIVAICYSLIPEVFPRAFVPRVFAAEAVVWALAGIFGPLAGGAVTDAFGWRMSFLTAIPLLAVFASVARRVLPREPAEPSALGGLIRLWPVAVSLAGAAAVSAPVMMDSAGAGLVAAGVGSALLIYAFRADGRQENPVFPRGSFRADAMGLGMWTMALACIAHYFAQPFTALALQERFGLGATWVGTGSVALALSWSGVAFLTSAPSFDALRARFVVLGPLALAIGAAMTAAGIAGLSLSAAILGQIVIGAGFALLWGAVTQSVMENAPVGEQDRAGGMMPTIASLGSAVGAGFGGGVAQWTGLPETIGRGAETAILAQWGAEAALALLAVATGAAQYRLVRRRTPARNP